MISTEGIELKLTCYLITLMTLPCPRVKMTQSCSTTVPGYRGGRFLKVEFTREYVEVVFIFFYVARLTLD